jgi:calpain-7
MSQKETGNLGYNPQFCLEIDNKSEQSSAVSLLLSRHITVTEEESEDFITLHVYNDTNGEKIYYPRTPWKEVFLLLKKKTLFHFILKNYSI